MMVSLLREVFDPRTWSKDDKKLFIQVSFLVGVLVGIEVFLGVHT